MLQSLHGIVERVHVGTVGRSYVFVPGFGEIVVRHGSGRRDQLFPRIRASLGELEERRHGTGSAVVTEVPLGVGLFGEDDVDRLAEAGDVRERVGGVDHVGGHLAVGLSGNASVLGGRWTGLLMRRTRQLPHDLISPPTSGFVNHCPLPD